MYFSHRLTISQKAINREFMTHILIGLRIAEVGFNKIEVNLRKSQADQSNAKKMLFLKHIKNTFQK